MKLFDKFDEALWGYCVRTSMTENEYDIAASIQDGLTKEQSEAAYKMAVADCGYAYIKGMIKGIAVFTVGAMSSLVIRELVIPSVKRKIRLHKLNKAQKELNKLINEQAEEDK